MSKEKSKTIIIKRIKKGHGGHHGGSWKVAYADFVTALMAFFLLMWLITMVAPEKRLALALYFKHFSIFKESGGHTFLSGQSQIFSDPGGEVKSSDERANEPNEVPNPDMGTRKPVEAEPQRIGEALKKQLAAELAGLQDNIVTHVTERYVRIEMIDTDGKSMFLSGSDVLTLDAKRLIRLITKNIKDLNILVAIEGHTDSDPLNRGGFTNWELSTARASSARREMEANGLSPDKIARVVGLADKQPLIKENPRDARNRRVSFIVMRDTMNPNADLSDDMPVTIDTIRNAAKEQIQPKKFEPPKEPPKGSEIPKVLR